MVSGIASRSLMSRSLKSERDLYKLYSEGVIIELIQGVCQMDYFGRCSF